MTEQITSALINELLSRTNIIDLINKRITLKKRGKNFYAYCPFHHENNPSFTVNFEKQFYYCFSCGAHGNAIDFLIHYEHLKFHESIEELAHIHGIHISFKSKLTNLYFKHQKQNDLYQLMNNLSNFYHNNLIDKSNIQAYQYLKFRGLNQNIIEYFKIGFAQPGWNNLITKFTNYKNSLSKLGMLITNNKGNTYDRFRQRIIFPIHNKHGQVIGFGGRILGPGKPKYLNSPDTDIFHKRNQLYGLYELQKKQKLNSHILLVEGYMDVISLTQFGIYNSVASLGTSTTIAHIQLLYRNTNNIICCYDGDYSGQKAAWRTLKTTLPYLTDTRTLHFAFLPKSDDPDTLIRKIGKYEFLKYIHAAKPLSSFLFEILLQKIDITTIEGRVKFSSLALSIIKKIPGNILRIHLRQKLGTKIGIFDDNLLNKLLNTNNKSNINNKQKNNITLQNKLKHTKINILIALLIQTPKFASLIPNIQGLEKTKQVNIILLIELIKFYKQYPQITPGQTLEFYRNSNYYEIIKEFTIWDHMIPNNISEKVFIDTLTNLYNAILREKQEILIATARKRILTKEEQKKLWLINKKLAK